MKKRLVYWIAPKVTPEQLQKATLLEGKDFEVRFFNDVQALIPEFSANRAAVVVVGDDGNEAEVKLIMMKLMASPETYGVRLVLATSQHQSDTVRTAFALGFRDIIPLDLEGGKWLKRFLFSTSGTPIPLTSPHPMMSLNAISVVSVPARLVWLSPSRMRLETKVIPQVGTKLHLAGAMAHYLGMKTLTLTVEQHVKQNLRFRFADAMVCQWGVQEELLPKKNLLLEHLRKMDTGASCRVFAILHTSEIRSEMLETLRAPRFEIATALSKKSIVEEPKYFSPHIIFIEDKLCDDDHLPYLQELNKVTDPNVPIVVIGTNTNYDRLRAMGRKIIPLPQIRPTLPRMIFEKYLSGQKWRNSYGEPQDAFLVNVTNEFSFAEVRIPARLRQIHPEAASIALPTKLGNFGLCRIESPFMTKTLGRGAFAKITDSYTDTRMNSEGFPHLLDCTFINVSPKEKESVAESLGEIMRRQLLKTNKAENGDETAPAPTEEKAPAPVMEAVAKIATRPIDIEEPPPDPLEQIAKKIGEQVDLSALFSSLKPVLLFLAVTLAVFLGLGFVTFRLAPSYEKSGGVYSDQLKQFQSKVRPDKE